MDDARRQLVERLFDAFNRRDAEEIVALCDEGMEFFAVHRGGGRAQRPLRRARRACAPTSTTSPRSGRSC